MKCDKCGFTPNIGDQVCMNCGAKLSSSNASMPGVEAFKIKEENINKSNKSLIVVFTVIGIIIISVIIFLVIKYVIL